MNDAVAQFQAVSGPKVPEAFYDIQRKEFLVKDKREDWMPFNETQFKRLLRGNGLSTKADGSEPLSPLDKAIIETQTEQNVHFSGALAGWRKGFHESGSVRMLVTTSPVIIEPVAGNWDMLYSIITQLLGDLDGVQFPHFYGWLKIAYEALRAERIRPGQVMVFCGPHNCGKSLLQNLLTLILGGRSARPYQAMTGDTSFNSDLFGAEHLMVEDESPASDIKARRTFGAQIKGITVNEVQRLHAKHRDAVVLRPFWRMTVSLNDEAENVQVLPPMDDSLEDKLIILKATRCVMPMPTGTMEQRDAFWSTLVGELPAFLHFLTTYDIPDELKCQRFGVKHFHHPEIVGILDSMAPETRLLTLIDSALFGRAAQPSVNGPAGSPGIEPRLMTAEELESELTAQTSPCLFEARRLLSWINSCGSYLGRLARKRPDRVQSARGSDARRWRIIPPEGVTP